MADEEENVDDKSTRFKEKHSLDSDEEDDESKKYDVLAEDDIEGQEEATIEFDDDTQIMPFNMREEMEEGHFDADGTYIFDKTKEIRDNWIDNIDWVKVKHTSADELAKKRPFEDSSSDEEEDEGKRKDKTIKTYEAILGILKEGETVAKAIRRLGKNKSKIPSASQRWKAKKKKTVSGSGSGEVGSDQAAIDQAVEEQKQMLQLTELCNELLKDGIMDIYETQYERISFTLKQMKEKERKSRLTIADDVDDDDALDMFADDFDTKAGAKNKNSSEKDASDTKDNSSSTGEFKKPAVPPAPTESGTSGSGGGVMWEYKETDAEDDDVKGPFTTQQMMKWSTDGTFGKGVLCRKHQSGGQFYNSARLDFDLYDE